MDIRPFHYAFKVMDIPSTLTFYRDILGCNTGRYTDTWVDFDFFGHQLSAHVSTNIPPLDYCGKVDGIVVPMPHFGILLTETQFADVRVRLEAANISFIVPPQLRYKGEVGEQWTMFFLDPSQNPIEVKCFTNEDEIFAR